MSFKILTLNNIAVEGLRHLPRELYEVASEIGHPDGILVRSANMHDMDIPESVKAIARAGAGVNNIPVAAMSRRGIPVFNAPGANANAVKELVLTGLLLSSRGITGGINFVQTLGDMTEAAELARFLEQRVPVRDTGRSDDAAHVSGQRVITQT